MNTAINEALEGTAETRTIKRKAPDEGRKAARKTNEAHEYRSTLQRPRLNLGGRENEAQAVAVLKIKLANRSPRTQHTRPLCFLTEVQRKLTYILFRERKGAEGKGAEVE